MSERAKYRGQLAEEEELEARLKIRLEGLVESLRDQLSPFVEPGTLKGEIIASQGIEFASVQQELLEARKKITAIRQYLGME
jgi:hypothetical protein